MILKTHTVAVGIFVTVGVFLFAAALFLIGNEHKAFRRHLDFYTAFKNIDGIAKGSKVKVHGMDAGEVETIQLPSSPSQPFRLKLHVDERLHELVRNDSLVTIETEGLVGDKYLLVRDGTDHAPLAAPDSTIPSKEPFEMSKMLEQAQGLLKQTNATITDVQGHVDKTLDTMTGTIQNANGIVNDIRGGKGTAGLLLENKETAADVQQTVRNTRQATVQLNQSVAKVDAILADVQNRQLVGKMDDTLNNAKGATDQLNQTSKQLNTTLGEAFANDQYGQSAGQNLQQSLSNVNLATGNLAEDTEALKHEFFFKGFFKHRGYYNLDDLPVDQYRNGTLFKQHPSQRYWLDAKTLFITGRDGREELSPEGRQQIDAAVSQLKDLYTTPILVEGYAENAPNSAQLFESRHRAMMVRAYLELHYAVPPKNTGIIGLMATPPAQSGKSAWDGVSIVALPAGSQK